MGLIANTCRAVGSRMGPIDVSVLPDTDEVLRSRQLYSPHVCVPLCPQVRARVHTNTVTHTTHTSVLQMEESFLPDHLQWGLKLFSHSRHFIHSFIHVLH